MSYGRSGERAETSYLESLSDLFVGFLFIFIILLMTFALGLVQAQQRTETEQNLLINADQLRAEMLHAIQRALARRGIAIEIDTRNGIARLPESLLFDSGDAHLRAGAGAKLDVVAQELSRILPCYATGVPRGPSCPHDSRPILDALFVEGHTDSIPIQTAEYQDNYDLSAQRAKQTFAVLVRPPSDLDRLRNDDGQALLSLGAYGAERPVASNATEEGRRRNRRIDLRFVVTTPRVARAATPARP